MKLIAATTLVSSLVTYLNAEKPTTCISPIIAGGSHEDMCIGYKQKVFQRVGCKSKAAKRLKVEDDGSLCSKDRCLIYKAKKGKVALKMSKGKRFPRVQMDYHPEKNCLQAFAPKAISLKYPKFWNGKINFDSSNTAEMVKCTIPKPTTPEPTTPEPTTPKPTTPEPTTPEPTTCPPGAVCRGRYLGEVTEANIFTLEFTFVYGAGNEVGLDKITSLLHFGNTKEDLRPSIKLWPVLPTRLRFLYYMYSCHSRGTYIAEIPPAKEGQVLKIKVTTTPLNNNNESRLLSFYVNGELRQKGNTPDCPKDCQPNCHNGQGEQKSTVGSKVKVYAGNPWENPAKGKISDVVYNGQKLV